MFDLDEVAIFGSSEINEFSPEGRVYADLGDPSAAGEAYQEMTDIS